MEKSGEGFAQNWKIDQRPLREKLIQPNAIDDETRFSMKQIVGGIEDGLAIVAEHEGVVVASLVAELQPENSTMRLIDLRVDFDRAPGPGFGPSVSIHPANEGNGIARRSAQTKTNNLPAANFLLKRGLRSGGTGYTSPFQS